MAGPTPSHPTLSGSVPRHVAVIMDGNGRWAADRGLPRHEGHRAGMKAVREAMEVMRTDLKEEACLPIYGDRTKLRMLDMANGIAEALDALEMSVHECAELVGAGRGKENAVPDRDGDAGILFEEEIGG